MLIRMLLILWNEIMRVLVHSYMGTSKPETRVWRLKAVKKK